MCSICDRAQLLASARTSADKHSQHVILARVDYPLVGDITSLERHTPVSFSRADPGSFLFPVVPPLFGSGTRKGWLSTITAGLLGPSLLGISLPRIRNTNANTVPSTSVHGTPPRYRLSAVLTVVLQLACKVGKTSSLATPRKTAHSTF